MVIGDFDLVGIASPKLEAHAILIDVLPFCTGHPASAEAFIE